MSEFKVGDRVIHDKDPYPYYARVFGERGTIVESVMCGNLALVDWDNHKDFRTRIYTNRLSKVKTMEYEVGQILIDFEGYEHKILSVNDELVFYEDDNGRGDSGQVAYASTPAWLKERGWKVKNETVKEVTLDEIAEKFGVDADKIRVKKED